MVQRRPLQQPTGSPRLSRRRAIGLTSAGAGAAAFLAACGGNRNGASGKTTASSAPGKPKSGGHLTLSQTSDPSNFDPSIKSGGSAQIMGLTNNRLVGLKTGADVKFEDVILIPELAQKWEAPDAQTYTFHLQPNVQFANLPPVKGRAVTAADVKWSFEYLTRSGALKDKKLPPSTVATLFEGLEQIDAPDDNTVVMHLAQPFSPFLTYVSSEFGSVIAHEIFDQDGDFVKHTAGTGPWQLDTTATQKSARWVFKRNPTYFQEGLPYIDEIDNLVLPDPATSKAAFQTRQLDHWQGTDVTKDIVDQMKRAVPDIDVEQHLNPDPNHVYLNQQNPILRDLRVRQAIALSIDRDEFLKVFSAGQGEWALAASLPGFFTHGEIHQIIKYDPNQAKQLASAAGYPNGVPVSLLYPYDMGQTRIQIAQLFQAQLKNGGINLALEAVDYATYSARKRTGNYDIGMDPRTGIGDADPDGTLYAVFHPGSSGNYAHIDDPVLTPLLEAQRRELDQNKRTPIIRQAVQRIADQVWAVALFFGISYDLAQPYFKNYAPNRAAWGERFTTSWLEK